MNLRTNNDLQILTALTTTQRLERELSNVYGLSKMQTTIILLIGVCAATPGLPDTLSEAQIKRLGGFADGTIMNINRDCRALSGDEAAPLIKYRGKPSKYGLSGTGVQIVRKCIELSKSFIDDICLLATDSEYDF